MDIVDAVALLAMRLSRLEGRVAGTMRRGLVAAVDPSRQRCRLRLGGSDEEPFLGPWVPYGQHAGALKVHAPPTIGQQMAMLATGGDPRQAIAVPMTWSNENPAPSDGEDPVLTYKDIRVELAEGRALVKVGETSLELTVEAITALAALTTLDSPVEMPKGFAASNAAGPAGAVSGDLDVTGTISSDTAVVAPAFVEG